MIIDYIKYTIDGSTYNLKKDITGNWVRDLKAPLLEGKYNILLEVGSGSTVTYVDSSDPRYNIYLEVIRRAERKNYIEQYVPEFIGQLEQFRTLYGIENLIFDELDEGVKRTISDAFISTSSSEAITRYENFLNIKGVGTLEQRKNYIRSLIQKGNKLNESSIKDIVNAITGSDCIVKFYGSDELNNPERGKSLLQVQVLSPDVYKDYRYEDIERALKNLIPGHITLSVVRFFATWEDIRNNFAGWDSIKAMNNWGDIHNYIPPQ